MFHRRNWETVVGLDDQAEHAFARGDFVGGLSLTGEAASLTEDLSQEKDLFADVNDSEGYFSAAPQRFPRRR